METEITQLTDLAHPLTSNSLSRSVINCSITLSLPMRKQKTAVEYETTEK